MFYVFSFPPAVYVGTFNLIASIPGPSILTCIFVCFNRYLQKTVGTTIETSIIPQIKDIVKKCLLLIKEVCLFFFIQLCCCQIIQYIYT